MAVWAYECEPCGDGETTYFASWEVVNEFPLRVTIVKVRVGRRWLCARLDRTRRVQVERMLVRDVIATEAENCANCKDE